MSKGTPASTSSWNMLQLRPLNFPLRPFDLGFAHAVLLRSQETPLHRQTTTPTPLFFFQLNSCPFTPTSISSSPAMSDHWNRLSEHHKRICLFPMPRIPRLGPKARDTAIYVSGALASPLRLSLLRCRWQTTLLFAE